MPDVKKCPTSTRAVLMLTNEEGEEVEDDDSGGGGSQWLWLDPRSRLTRRPPLRGGTAVGAAARRPPKPRPPRPRRGSSLSWALSRLPAGEPQTMKARSSQIVATHEQRSCMASRAKLYEAVVCILAIKR